MPPELPDIEGYPSLAEALAAPAYRARVEAALPAFLLARRWFADRAARSFDVRIEDALPVGPAGGLVLAVVRVETASGISRYQVPLLAAPAGGVVDALDTADGAEAFLDALLHARDGSGLTIEVTGPLIAGPARILAGEQSNTSVVYGGDDSRCILKLLRRLEPGRNPDAELTAWLSGPGRFTGVPRVLAAARIAMDTGAGTGASWSADSLVVQDFVANDGDGWSWALERARAASEAVNAGAAPAEWLASPAGRELLGGAEALGDVTAGLHLALASATGDGLQPLPFTREDWDVLTDGVHRDIDGAAAASGGLSSEAPALLARLHRAVPAAPEDFGLKTRVHGDYHLGQVLHTPGGWVIVDFEGEPARPLAERVALQHPLADVAGMLRSWDYAGATAAGSAREAWVAAACGAFLGAYRAKAVRAASLPGSREAQDALLRLFVLRKALYELRYELGSRPAWAAIPLGALERMAQEA